MLSWDDIVYDVKLAAYNAGLRATPPVVVPVDSIPASAAIQQEVDQEEQDFTYTNFAVNAVKQTATQIADAAKIGIPTLAIFAIAGLILYLYLKGKKIL
jgi:hypothetical protein